MNGSVQSELDGSMLSLAFKAGLWDSINPYALATVLIFIILVSLYGYNARRVGLIGGLYVCVSAAVQYISLMGYCDVLLTNINIINMINVLYFTLAIFFILIGVNDLWDWRRYTAKNDTDVFRMPLPAIFREKQDRPTSSWKAKFLEWSALLVLTVLVSACATFMSGILPQDEYMFIVHSFFKAGGDKAFVYRSFALYSLATVLLLIVACIKIWWLALMKKQSTQALIYYKLVLSAIFLSTGAGLGYYLVK